MAPILLAPWSAALCVAVILANALFIWPYLRDAVSRFRASRCESKDRYTPRKM